MRFLLRPDTLLVLALTALLAAYPLIEYGLRENGAATVAGAALGLIGLAAPAVAHLWSPDPEDARVVAGAGEEGQRH